MFWIELLIVLAIIFWGVRKGGPFLAMAGGIGMFIMVFILRVKPSDPPITVILIMIAVICAASMLQACGGLDLLVRIAEKILRKNPKMITVMAPLVAWLFTFMCGTGHIVYSLLPVIDEIAMQTGVRPERPIAASIVSSQFAITACPLSAATVAVLSFVAESPYASQINMFTLLCVAIPATLCGTIAAALVMLKKGKELADDPEFQRRLAAGEIEDFSKREHKEVEATKEEKTSVTIFLIAMVAIVVMGAGAKILLPTFADESKLALTTVIEMFMLVAAGLMVVFCKVDSNKLLDQPVFKTGMFAVILAFGLCWLVNTFIGDQASFITENMAAMTNVYRPEMSFNSFIGCPLNGIWSIKVMDADSTNNGYLYDFELVLKEDSVYHYNPTYCATSSASNSEITPDNTRQESRLLQRQRRNRRQGQLLPDLYADVPAQKGTSERDPVQHRFFGFERQDIKPLRFEPPQVGHDARRSKTEPA